MTQGTDLLKFKAIFNNDLLKSEILRSKIIIGTAVFGIVQSLILYIFFEEWIETIFRDKHFYLFIAGFLSLMIITELLILTIINRIDKVHSAIRNSYRVIGSIIEISIPTSILVILSVNVGGFFILDSPVSLFYFILIILSALHLDFRISFITGLTAAIEYVALSLIILSTFDHSDVSDYHQSNILYVMRGVVMVIGGLVAGFVADQIKKRV
ncbi:MAG: hypothetical protein IH946_03700, partial [Bacteroidetes bacterium]|nr:hypothetical protein [Bacteroidota bacterium]